MDKKRRAPGGAQPRRRRANASAKALRRPAPLTLAVRRVLAATAVGVLVVLASTGCTAPAVEGYQLQAPPDGFLYSAQQTPGAGVVPGRAPDGGGFWFGDIRSDEPRTTVALARYRGPLSEADAGAARDARAQVLRGSPYNRLGPLRTLTLSDGHTAAAWTEERHDEYGRFRSLQVTAVVSYDTVSFALELDTSVPERMTEAHLDSILATFALGVTAVNWVLVAVTGGVAALLLAALLRRAGRRQPTDYRTARIPKPPGTAGGAEAGTDEGARGKRPG